MKTALVTGASGDLGAAIARRLASDGHALVLHANHRAEKAEALAREIVDGGGVAETAVFDITDHDACGEILTTLAERTPIQIVVNNAGIHADAPMVGMTCAQWREVVDVSLHGFFNVTRPLLMPMIRTRWGRIVNISSVAGVMGNRGQTNYAAAKAGLHGATKSLAIELASRGITVNAVAPGIIAAGMAKGGFDRETIKALVPMKRAGEPGEVAALVAFLCSDESAYISGQVIGINGAMA